MTPDEIRIAIAECCGLDVIYDAAGPKDRPNAWRTGYFTPKAARDRRKRWPSSAHVMQVPDYPASLDACAEFEKTLKTDDLIDYAEWLGATSNEMHMKSWVVLLRATALQRCEAFLRTKGKWKE